MNIVTNFFTNLFGLTHKNSSAEEEAMIADLMRRESEIGRRLFGPVPNGVRREFFCLDEQTWVWHEENPKGTRVTKYVVKDKEVVKSVNGSHYERVSLDEAKNLRDAAKNYQKRVQTEVYSS